VSGKEGLVYRKLTYWILGVVGVTLGVCLQLACFAYLVRKPPTQAVFEPKVLASNRCRVTVKLRVDAKLNCVESKKVIQAAKNWFDASLGSICFLLWWEKLDETKERASGQSDRISTLYSGKAAWHRKTVRDGCSSSSCLGLAIQGKHKAADIFLRNDDASVFRRLVEHEIGHVLGLGHSCNAKDLMYPSIGKRLIRKNLTDNDKSMLWCLILLNKVMTWDEICSPSRHKGKPDGC